METIYNKIISGLITISLSFASLFGAGGGVATQQDVKKVKEEIKIETSQESDMKLGSINYVAGKVYNLYGGGIGSSDTSITLTAFKTPVSNYNLVMSNFGTTGYVTIEPANTTRQEIVSFTGVTQNADGTATLTGVTRGLSPVSPYTASTTIQKAHSGGSVVVISNPPQLYDSFPAKSNDETITGSWSFPLTPTIDANPASKKYVDDTAFSGAGVIDASATARGVVELATGLEIASSTAVGSSGNLVVPASLATSTYNSATADLKVVVTQNNGKIDDNFIGSLASTTAVSGTGATLTQLVPVGSITAYASTTAPTGWLLANGDSVAVATYPNLHAIIGYSYGGAGANFTLPDMRGRNILMASTTANVGQTGGESNHTLTVAELAAHTHTMNQNGSAKNTGTGSGGAAGVNLGYSTIAPTDSAGSDNAHNVLDPYMSLQYIIKY